MDRIQAHCSPTKMEQESEARACCAEALHGINNRDGGGTIFPQPLGMAAAFNRSLLRHVGDIISTEARAFNNRQVEAGGDPRSVPASV